MVSTFERKLLIVLFQITSNKEEEGGGSLYFFFLINFYGYILVLDISSRVLEISKFYQFFHRNIFLFYFIAFDEWIKLKNVMKIHLVFSFHYRFFYGKPISLIIIRCFSVHCIDSLGFFWSINLYSPPLPRFIYGKVAMVIFSLVKYIYVFLPMIEFTISSNIA